MRVRRRDRVVDVVGRASVRAASRVREFTHREVEFVLRAGGDVLHVVDFVDVLEDREGLSRRDVGRVPHRHAFRQLADLVLDFLPRLHRVLVLGLEGTHMAEAEAVGLLHDADGTVPANETLAVERTEERSAALEVVDLEEVFPLFAHNRPLVFEHAAVDLERQDFVGTVREHVALFRRDPAFGDERGDRCDHVDRARRNVLGRNRLRRDDRLVRRADEVELALDVLVAFDRVGSGHREHVVVHAAGFEKGRRGRGRHVDSPLLVVRDAI